jgi:hydroxypyruvate isomerase
MRRREILEAGAFAALAGLSGLFEGRASAAPRRSFKLRYAPHFGMFEASAGADLLDQLEFMADEGFTALEDNGMKGRDAATQERIASGLERLGMTMGVFVASADFGNVTFASDDSEVREHLLGEIRDSVAVAARVGARWMTVVPGCYDQRLEWDYQTAIVIDNLKRCAEICEPAGVVMVLEPLNWWRDHPGVFLHKIPQAYQICRAVGSPSCRILFDVYHQQITEGNLIPNLDRAWDQIAYIQVGDNPGRKEPTTGEINYRNVFRHLHGEGYEGLVGLEHGNSRPGIEGERAVIDAYVACDDY